MLQLPNKPHDGRAKDGETRKALGVSEGMVGMDRMVGSRTARHESLAIAGVDERDVVRLRTAHRHDLAAGRRHQHRLCRLLLLPRRSGTQGRIGGLAAPGAGPADCAAARPAAGGDRRFSHQALWAEGRGRRHPSQSDSRSRGPALSLWSHLGHAVVGLAASVVGRDRFAVAGLALRSSADDGEDSTPPRLEVCHQAGTGGAAGGMDRAVRQTSGKNPVDRGRWRIHQGSVLEARRRPA